MVYSHIFIMKKYVFISLLPFLFSICVADRYQWDFEYLIMESYLRNDIHGDSLTALNEEGFTYRKQQPLDRLSTYKPCSEFTKYQKSYNIIKQLWFLYPNNQYQEYLYNLGNTTPRNTIQKVIFPYWTEKYSAEWNGIQLLCEEQQSWTYQFGSVQFKGYIELENKSVFAERDERSAEVPFQEITFVITESLDPNISKLSWIKDNKFSLWCIGEAFGKDIIDGINVNIDTVNKEFNMDSTDWRFQRQSTVNHVPLFRKSDENPRKEITIEAKLNPNVIFNHELDIPCENSRIQSIEIIDDGGLL